MHSSVVESDVDLLEGGGASNVKGFYCYFIFVIFVIIIILVTITIIIIYMMRGFLNKFGSEMHSFISESHVDLLEGGGHRM